MHVLIAGGGTGGHLYPGISLAREFERQVPGSRVTFVGTVKGLEARVLPQEGFELRTIRVSGLIGLGILRKVRALFELPYALYQSFQLLRIIRPGLVIGVGGYASGPVVLMAWVLSLPRVLVEPNAIPGWTNRFLAPLAQRIFVSFEESRRYLSPKNRVRVTGNPVRREIQTSQAPSRAPAGTRSILIMGGSQGAHSINKAMVEALGSLESMKQQLRIIHQTGERDYEWVREAYEKQGFDAMIKPYLKNVEEAYAVSDLVVSRSGATTVAELTACGLPAILIPFPHATHGHQEANARVLENAGAATIILDSDLTGPVLASGIHSLLMDPMSFHEMGRNSRALGQPQAAQKIVVECLAIAKAGKR